MHGQSAYGYTTATTRSASTSSTVNTSNDKKGKGKERERDMSTSATSAPSHSEDISSLDVSAVHYADYPSCSTPHYHLENQSPMIGLKTSDSINKDRSIMDKQRERFKNRVNSHEKPHMMQPDHSSIKANQPSHSSLSSRSASAISPATTSSANASTSSASSGKSTATPSTNKRASVMFDPEAIAARHAEIEAKKIFNELRQQELAQRTPEQRLRTRVSRKIWQLFGKPIPDKLEAKGVEEGKDEAVRVDLSSVTTISITQLKRFPVFQACELIKEIVGLDCREGLGPLHTIRARTINVLFGMLMKGEPSRDLSPADTVIAANNTSALEKFAILSGIQELYTILDNIEAVDSEGNPLSFSAKEAYLRLLAEEVFGIVDLLNNDISKEVSSSLAKHTNSQAAARIENSQIDQPLCTIVALAHQNPFYLASAVLLNAPRWSELKKARQGKASAKVLRSALKDTALPQLIKILQRPSTENISTYEAALRAMEYLLRVLRDHPVPYLTSTLIFSLMHLPVPPPPLIQEHTTEIALRFEAAREAHSHLFQAVHACLVKLLQCAINSSTSQATSPKKREYWRIKCRKTQWILHNSNSLPSQVELNEDRHRMYNLKDDSIALQDLLRYAYRHLQSTTIAGKMYDVCIGMKHISHRTLQRFAAIRLRGETLLHHNGSAERLITQIISNLAESSNLPLYQPMPRTKKLSLEEDIRMDEIDQRAEALWTVEVLFRCRHLDMSLLSSILAYWTATNQTYQLRCFMHHFFSIHRQMEVAESPGSRSSVANVMMHTIADASLSLFEPVIPMAQARKSIDRMLKDAEIMVVLMNAAAKIGNTSIAEKCWLVACQLEETRSVWRLPVAAYTIMLQVYEAEARKEAALTRKRRRASGLVGDYTASRESSSHSRITYQERAEALLQHKQACIGFSTAIYHRFAEKATLEDADDHFFKAALKMFGGRTKQYRQAQAALRALTEHTVEESQEVKEFSESSSDAGSETTDSGFGSSDSEIDDAVSQDEHPLKMLHIVVADSRNAGLAVPRWADETVPADAQGMLVKASSAEVVAGRSLSRSRSPLLQWLNGSAYDLLDNVLTYRVIKDRGSVRAMRAIPEFDAIGIE